jgi:hypothetical protein
LFSNALPGTVRQDGIEYGSHTHHTNLDTYERDRSRRATPPSSSPARSTSWPCATSSRRFAADKMPPPLPRGAAATDFATVVWPRTNTDQQSDLCLSVFVRGK